MSPTGHILLVSKRYRGLAHPQHEASLNKVIDVLEAEGLRYTHVPLSRVWSVQDFDWVITVGGDGTVLETSHHVDDQPLLGVNSMPVKSVGFFCGATAGTFRRMLRRVVKGRAETQPLNRLSVHLNRRPISIRVLNDILFSHENPAAMTSYTLHIGRRREKQRCSGIWLSTAAGSTAAIASAGGKRMDVLSCRIQYLVREPFMGTGKPLKLLNGEVDGDKGLRMISLMERSAIFLDGHYRAIHLNFEDEIVIRNSATPLNIYGIDVNRYPAKKSK